jgi:uncharacterized protein (DUF885 family)
VSKTKSRFEGSLSRYFEQLLEDEPVFATISAGLSSGEGKPGTLSARFHEARERKRRAALAALEDQSPGELSNEQQIDRLALRSRLLRECEDYSRNRHELEPNAPEHLLGILFHELRRGQDHPKRAAANLRSLLKRAPEFLAEAAETLRTPERVWLRVMEQTVQGGAVLLEGVRTFLAGTDPKPADTPSVESSLRAMRRYEQAAKVLPPAPQGSFAVGTSNSNDVSEMSWDWITR